MTSPQPLESDSRIPRPVLALAIALCLFTIAFVYVGRLVAPNDLYRKDQGKTMAYTVDVIVNGRFSLPRDPIFQPATKPPLYNWLAAAFVGPTGIYDEWAHKMPSLVATLVIAGMIVVWCRRRFSDAFDGTHAFLLGAFAATIFVASKSPMLLMYIARPDMLQAACLVAAWLAGHAALSKPTKGEATRFAILYWIAVTAAALAKGPAAVYPILYVLLAAPLCFGDWRRLRNLRWLPGLALLLGSVGLWLVCAARQDREHVFGVLLGSEVAKRIAVSRIEGGTKPWNQSIIWFIAQNTVWSYLMLGSMAVSLLGSARRLLVRDDIRPDTGRLERSEADHVDRSVVESERGAALDYEARIPVASKLRRTCNAIRVQTSRTKPVFDAMKIRSTDGFFTGAAGAANLWAIVVIACLSVPKDKRMDFLLPAHPAAAILAAHFIIFCIARFPWARFALPLAGAVFLLDEKRTVSNAYVIAAVVATVAIVFALIELLRRAPRLLPIVFGVVLVGFLAFEVLTNTRFGIAKTSPAMSYAGLFFGAGIVAAVGIAAFRKLRPEVPLIAFGVLFWSYALLQNTYKDTNLPTGWKAATTPWEKVVGRIYSSDPNSSGTGPGVYAARFAKEARKFVGDDSVVMLVRSKSPILSLMGKHQGSNLTRADFENAKWVIAERSKFRSLNDTPAEACFSGILDVDYGSITGEGDIYKDRLGLYRIEKGVPSVNEMISIFRWAQNWSTKDANPYRSKNTGWIETPDQPPMWTPPAGDPWSDPRLRKKGGRGD